MEDFGEAIQVSGLGTRAEDVMMGMANDVPPQGRRVTRPRLLISQLLMETRSFVTAQDVADRLRQRGTGIGVTTVYRNLRMMAEHGELDVIHVNGEAMYRACADHRHHHHIVCRGCGKTVEIEIPGLEEWIERAAGKLRFTDISHNLEIFGLCSQCAASRRRPKEE